MYIRNRSITLVMALVVILAYAQATSADIYKCIDKDGMIHFSNVPCPECGKYEDMKLVDIADAYQHISERPEFAKRDLLEKRTEYISRIITGAMASKKLFIKLHYPYDFMYDYDPDKEQLTVSLTLNYAWEFGNSIKQFKYVPVKSSAETKKISRFRHHRYGISSAFGFTHSNIQAYEIQVALPIEEARLIRQGDDFLIDVILEFQPFPHASGEEFILIATTPNRERYPIRILSGHIIRAFIVSPITKKVYGCSKYL